MAAESNRPERPSPPSWIMLATALAGLARALIELIERIA